MEVSYRNPHMPRGAVQPLEMRGKNLNKEAQSSELPSRPRQYPQPHLRSLGRLLLGTSFLLGLCFSAVSGPFIFLLVRVSMEIHQVGFLDERI